MTRNRSQQQQKSELVNNLRGIIVFKVMSHPANVEVLKEAGSAPVPGGGQHPP